MKQSAHRFYSNRIKGALLFRSGILMLILFTLFSCSTYSPGERGLWHVLKPGETLDSISSKYSVPIAEIRYLNDIYDLEDLSPGYRLFIPVPERIETAPKAQQPQAVPPVQGAATTRLSWPSPGTISSGYGIRQGRMHYGIDITRDKGRDIRAAADGIVEFAGAQNGYGNTIIINHGNSFKTLYGHNARNYVKKGMRVKRGVIIAQMGATGKSNGIHLHFEVRDRGRAQNPLRYLPIR